MKNFQRPKKNRALFSVWVWLTYDSTRFREKNLEFLTSHQIPESQIIHISQNSKTVIIKATAREIRRIRKSPLCLDITLYKEKIPQKNSSELILRQISADSQSGTNSAFFNNGAGYSGQGITFGMISAERTIFNSQSPQLQRALLNGRISVLDYPLPALTDIHPSVVLSEIIGEKIEVEGKIYEGIAKNSSVVFSTSETDIDVLQAIDKLILRGVKIINYSAGIIGNPEYTDFDREIDRLVFHNNILFVTASGNRRSVSSPGSAWNTLAVGNLQTKSSQNTPSTPPYSIWCKNNVNCSGYVTPNTLAHKPDVVAPGSFIPYISPYYTVECENVGTSFAVPWVTGIAVQISEVLPNASHLTLKGIIALSADRSVISDAFNPIIDREPFCRELTGFGLVNSESALRCAMECETLTEKGNFRRLISLFSGEEFLCALVFDQTDESAASLSLSMSFENFTLSADRPYQNLHLLEYRADRNVSFTLEVSGTSTEFTLILWRK